MSYRFQPSAQPGPRLPAARQVMIVMVIAFVVVSLIVLWAGRLPVVPPVTPLSGNTYRDYVVPDRELLSTYGRNADGTIHIPIERAMDLTAERGLPTRQSPTAAP